MKAVLLALALAACIAACGQLTPQDQSDLALYQAQQQVCIDHNETRAAIDTCRAQVETSWRARWHTRFDGGFE